VGKISNFEYSPFSVTVGQFDPSTAIMSLNVRFHVGQMLIQNPQLTAQNRHLRLSAAAFCSTALSLIGILRETAAARRGR
jgi:hypothetical protein